GALGRAGARKDLRYLLFMITILDGPTGTELARRGLPTPAPAWSARAIEEAPAILSALHPDYPAAAATAPPAATLPPRPPPAPPRPPPPGAPGAGRAGPAGRGPSPVPPPPPATGSPEAWPPWKTATAPTSPLLSPTLASSTAPSAGCWPTPGSTSSSARH